MKSIYHSKKMVIGIIFISFLLIFSGVMEDNLTYKFVFSIFGCIFLLFSLYAIKYPAVKIENTVIQVRQFFEFRFKVVKLSNFSFYKKIGKSRVCLYGTDRKLLLKLGFFSHHDLEDILASLKLKQL